MDIPEWVAFFTRPQWSEKYVSTTSTVPTKLRWQAPGASFEDGTLVSYDKNGFPYGITAFGIPAWDRSYLRSLAYGMLAASRDAGAGAGDKPRDGSECVPGEISVGDGGDSTTYKSVGNVHKQPTGSHQASEELNCIPCDDKSYRVTFGPEIPINMKTGQPLTVEARKITHNQFRSEFPFNDPEISSAALHLDRQEDIGSWIYRNDADLARSLANFAGYPMGSWKELRNSFSGPTRYNENMQWARIGAGDWFDVPPPDPRKTPGGTGKPKCCIPDCDFDVNTQRDQEEEELPPHPAWSSLFNFEDYSTQSGRFKIPKVLKPFLDTSLGQALALSIKGHMLAVCVRIDVKCTPPIRGPVIYPPMKRTDDGGYEPFEEYANRVFGDIDYIWPGPTQPLLRPARKPRREAGTRYWRPPMSPETFDTIGPRSPDYGYAEWLGDAANTEFSRHMLSTPNDDDNLERSHGSDARPSQRSPDVGGGVFGRGVSRCHASIGCQGSSTRHYVNGV